MADESTIMEMMEEMEAYFNERDKLFQEREEAYRKRYDELIRRETDLKENGNPPAEFVVNLITAFRVNVADVEKVATINEKVATSEQKVATPDDKIATGKKYKSAEEMAIYILEYCETWRSIDEIAQFTDRDKNYIRNKVLPKLAEKLEKEFPNTPNHPKQRYRTKQKEADA